MAPPSKYSPEFREEAVQIALRSSKTVSETARELELNPETLRGWVKKHQEQHEPEGCHYSRIVLTCWFTRSPGEP
ncbi:transposase [Streptomyces sp. NPDC058297]|uniref:transposase n=1 Tax=Streptomyces sp. NPDC058297 TaxID=3346433 RepID=UPI0036E58974